MADSSTQSIIIGASPDRVAAVICDFPSYPEWTEAVRRAEVIEEYEDGYASQVRFTIDAGVMADEYVLAYEYAEDLSRDRVAPGRAVEDAEAPSAARTTWSATRTARPR